MSLKIISKQDMAPFVSSVMSQYDVLGPVAKEDKFVFAPLTDAAQLRLDYNTTILPPKKALLPQEETLFTFKTDGSFTVQPVFDIRPPAARNCSLSRKMYSRALWMALLAKEMTSKGSLTVSPSSAASLLMRPSLPEATPVSMMVIRSSGSFSAFHFIAAW